MAWKPDYATGAELADYMHIDDADDDLFLALAVGAASRAIDQAANRQFGLVDAPEARTYQAGYDGCRGQWFAWIDDLMTIAGLTIAVPAGAITAYELEPFYAQAAGQPWTRLYVEGTSAVQPAIAANGQARMTITAAWGWTEVPATIHQATLLQGSRIMTRRNSPLGVAGSPELGSEIRLLAKVDPDVAVMVAPYRRRRRMG